MKVLAGASEQLMPLLARPAEQPFSADTKDFLRDLSQALMARKSSDYYQDIAALGFWCRKANIQFLEQQYKSAQHQCLLLRPVGTVFQVAPANVEALFLYTGLLSLLLGNCTITRISSRQSTLFHELMQILKEVLHRTEYQSVAERFFVVEFDHTDPAFAELSKSCDLRIMWGADNTIYQLRQSPLAARAKELTFAGKTSLALFSLRHVAQLKEQKSDRYQRLLEDFCRDAFSFNQQACSSVKLVAWLVQPFEEEGLSPFIMQFWSDVNDYMTEQVQHGPSTEAMTRLVAAQGLCAAGCEVTASHHFDRFMVLTTHAFTAVVHAYHAGNGLFLQRRIDTLDSLFSGLDKGYQTLSYFGLGREELSKALLAVNSAGSEQTLGVQCGINRVVPVGSAVTFSPVWDGYDLFAEMTTKLSLS